MDPLSGWLEHAAVTKPDSQDRWTELSLQSYGNMPVLKQIDISASLQSSNDFTFVFVTGVGAAILLLVV